MSCKRCNGTGNVEYRENVGEPDMSIWETFVEACPCCICKEQCPQCGAHTLTEADDNGDHFHCTACEWTYDPDKTSETERMYPDLPEEPEY